MKREAKKAPPFWRGRGYFFVCFVILTVVGMAKLLMSGVFLNPWVWFIFLLGVIPLMKGVVMVPQEERYVVELFNKFYGILGPGINWVVPWAMVIRAGLPVWRLPIPLFLEQPWIDFKKGGSAQLSQSTLWLRIIGKEEEEILDSVYNAVYEIEDWEQASKKEAEFRLRSVINSLTPDQALLYLSERGGETWWEVVDERFPELAQFMAAYGFAADEITVSDFNLSKEVLETRRRVYEAEREIRVAESKAKAAEFEATLKALGISGVITRIITGLCEAGYSESEARKLAPEVFNFVKGAETGSFFLTQLREGDGLGPLLSQIMGVMKKAGEKAE